jgi:hypothetical protein
LPHCYSNWSFNVVIVGEHRQVAHVAIKILLPMALASILSLESTAAILPQNPGNSETVDVRFPVPKYYQQYATQDGNPVPTTGRLSCSCHRTRAAAAAEGWVVLATVWSGPPPERLRELESRTFCGRAGRVTS